MIRGIRIKNFQSHKETSIEFIDGVNALIGLSDHGKTSVLRAIRWALDNRPLGEKFRSHWGGDTEVSLTFDDGSVITRRRTDSKNQYEIIPRGVLADKKLFEAFGQEPPAEVKEIADMNELSIGSQMEQAFLLSKHPGEVAQILNRVVNLDIIDSSIGAIRKKKMAADAALLISDQQIQQYTEKLEALDWVERAQQDIDNVERVSAMLQKVQDRKKKVEALLNEACEISKNLAPLLLLKQAGAALAGFDHIRLQRSSIVERKRVLESALAVHAVQTKIIQETDRLHKAGAALQKMEDLRDRTDVKRKQANDLNGLIERLYSAKKTLLQSEKLLESNAQLRQAEGVQRQRKDAEARRDNLSRLIRQLREQQKTVTRLAADAVYLKLELDRVMPDVCPLCGRS